MQLEQIIGLNLENNKNEILNSTIWKTINNGIDIGLRYVLPDFIEEEIINLKDNLINYGLKDGIKTTINSVIETGKQATGIITGDFENIGQIQNIIKRGGILDKLSDVLDSVINKVEDLGKIDKTISTALKKGKTSILSSIEKNIEGSLENQINSIKLVDKYIGNWKNYFEQRDFNGMQKEYLKMQHELKDLIPIHNIIKNVQYVENIHNLIKNNGQNFELTSDQMELAQKLS